MHLSLGEKLVMACAWNPHSERIAVGARRSAQIIDIVRHNKWCFNTLGGDVVTQFFGKTVGLRLL